MNAKRKAVEEKVLFAMDAMDPSGKNTTRYKNFFAKMSDSDFHTWMCNLRDGKDMIAIYFANLTDKITVDSLRTAAKTLGVKLFERLKLWDEPTKTWYITPKEYMILEVPVRRFSQFVDHKLCVPQMDKKIDILSGQVMRHYGRAGSISQVEVQALYAKNLKETIKELISIRGGDVVAQADFTRELEETGRASGIKTSNSMPRSAVTLKELFAGMLIDTNFAEY